MTGRKEQMASLEKFYESDTNNLTILYGRRGIGKTTLLREFAAGHRAVYFEAVPSDRNGMLVSFADIVSQQIHKKSEPTGYMGVMADIADSFEDRILIIVEEFQNIVKTDTLFMDSVTALLKHIITDKKVMVILTSSSISWVENSMVSAIGQAAYSINAFIKLKEFNFSDVVGMFPDTDAVNALYIYAVTGGIPEYLSLFDGSKNIKQNICGLFLGESAPFKNSMMYYLKDEFRETGVYNILLGCLAAGLNKLNEIHNITGYGRDKISVYLNNLIEREIVEKIFSYDRGSGRDVRKGLYRIKDGFAEFWYRLIQPGLPMAGIMEPDAFYDRYIARGLNGFCKEAYIKIATEFLQIMNDAGKLIPGAEYAGRWYGKTGDVHVIYTNADNEAVIGQVYTDEKPVGMEDYDKLIQDAGVAGLTAVQTYLFSLNGYDEELTGGRIPGLMAINIEDL